MSFGDEVDVCFLCEGCYPFVVGGVSEWVHSLIRGLPELRFAVVALTAAETPREPRYPRLPNLERLVRLDLSAAPLPVRTGPPPTPETWQSWRRFLRGLWRGRPAEVAPVLASLRGHGPATLGSRDILEGSPEGFAVLRDLAEELVPTAPLLETLAAYRSMLLPFLRVATAELPPARLYHATSTGYSGLLGAAARVSTGLPFLITEHGLYTKELEIEVRRATWIPDRQRACWANYFQGLGRVAYSQAQSVLALFEKNRRHQVGLGAPRARTRVIANGVDVEGFAVPRAPADGPVRVGLVGRVTPIKDVKTFLRAGFLLARDRPRLELHVLGPTDESPGYFLECQQLVDELDLGARVHFHGRVAVREWYPKLDVVMLTSVKEAQPLSLLEAMAAGCLVVGTDVGAVPELLRGVGEVRPARRPAELAAAAAALLELPDEARQARRDAGLVRARSYGRAAFLSSYRDIYRARRAARRGTA